MIDSLMEAWEQSLATLPVTSFGATSVSVLGPTPAQLCRELGPLQATVKYHCILLHTVT